MENYLLEMFELKSNVDFFVEVGDWIAFFTAVHKNNASYSIE